MVCPACKKTSGFRIKRVLLRGHYNPTVKQKQHPNLQWVKIGVGKRIKVCASCIKASQKNPNYFKKTAPSLVK
ncbi:MAG: 50S ribosomal protein L28 [Patescibacteria group bacterium]